MSSGIMGVILAMLGCLHCMIRGDLLAKKVKHTAQPLILTILLNLVMSFAFRPAATPAAEELAVGDTEGSGVLAVLRWIR